MQKYLFCLLIISSFQAKAQEWFSPESTWKFNIIIGGAPQENGINTLKVTGDTIIHNKSCKILTWYYITLPPANFYVYEEENRVYYFRDGSFEKIYDFNLAVGDTLFSKNIYGIVTETGITVVGGAPREYQKLKYENYNRYFVNRIGLVQSPDVPPFLSCGHFIHTILCSSALLGWKYYFMCYSNDELTYPSEEACTFPSSTKEETNSIKIYPNPVSDKLFIARQNEDLVSEIYNLQGDLIIKNIRENSVSLENLLSGIYILSTKNIHNTISLTKFVVIK